MDLGCEKRARFSPRTLSIWPSRNVVYAVALDKSSSSLPNAFSLVNCWLAELVREGARSLSSSACAASSLAAMIDADKCAEVSVSGSGDDPRSVSTKGGVAADAVAVIVEAMCVCVRVLLQYWRARGV